MTYLLPIHHNWEIHQAAGKQKLGKNDLNSEKKNASYAQPIMSICIVTFAAFLKIFRRKLEKYVKFFLKSLHTL